MKQTTHAGGDCARAEQLLPDAWSGELAGAEAAWLEGHLRGCAACGELAGFWQALGEIKPPAPDPLQRRRFEAALSAAMVPVSGRRWWQAGWPRALAAAAAGVVLVAGGAGGGWWLRGQVQTPAAAAEMAELRDEVHASSQLAVLSLLEQQSANERLQGVNYSKRVAPDGAIEAALLRSLRDDSSADVRLAALDALQRLGGGPAPQLRDQLVDAFADQQSPLVQVAMVDTFLELRPAAARPLLQKVAAEPQYAPEVRQRAAWGLTQWN